ncbi:hypothetical protein BVY03_04085 [bacterium K02(2017)]|nr:hypothetical protein BVY03_04085 [bacterium K02(2017)]
MADFGIKDVTGSISAGPYIEEVIGVELEASFSFRIWESKDKYKGKKQILDRFSGQGKQRISVLGPYVKIGGNSYSLPGEYLKTEDNLALELGLKLIQFDYESISAGMYFGGRINTSQQNSHLALGAEAKYHIKESPFTIGASLGTGSGSIQAALKAGLAF